MSYTETARRLAGAFHRAENDNLCIQDDHQDSETVREMVAAADQAGLANDDAYEMVAAALDQIADTDPDDILDTERDSLIDVYTRPLMDWLARNSTLADDMKDVYSQWPDTLFEIAQATQHYAYGLVLAAIANNWPDDEEDDPA